MNLIDILLGEHGVFYAMFDNLDGRVPKTERMGEVLSIARTLFAALASHIRLEDDIPTHLERSAAYYEKMKEDQEARRSEPGRGERGDRPSYRDSESDSRHEATAD